MAEKWALLVVDMLNDFVRKGAPLEVPAARGIVEGIQKRIQKSRDQGTPVIYLCDAHAPDDEEFAIWPAHAVRGTEGAQVIAKLAPEPGEAVIPKTRYSGFFRTNLEEQLRQRGVTGLILTGVVTNICILYTAADAVSRGYRVQVPGDCVAAVSSGDHRWALNQMRDVLQVEII
jgi:nicotinamidase-related amidase